MKRNMKMPRDSGVARLAELKARRVELDAEIDQLQREQRTSVLVT